MRWMVALVILFCTNGAGVAYGAPRPRPLVSLPAARLQAMAPLLRTTDIVLIETGDKGALKQITTVAYAAAPPETVRDVLIHPERYKDFVRNTKVCEVTPPEADGSFVHHYAVSYTLYTFDGKHRYVMLPPDGPGPGPVDMFDPDDNGEHHFRMEFLPAPGGGTVVALYGYTVVPHEGLVGKFLKAAPTLEYGLALIPQMAMLLAINARAEELTRSKPAPPLGPIVGYEFLLERGTVALLRRVAGKLVDMSLVLHSHARPDTLAKLMGDPLAWSTFVPTIARSTSLGQPSGVSTVELEQSLPLITFTSGFAFRSDGKSADLFGVTGDLRGGRLRWDVIPRGADAELVLRTILNYDRGSLVIRELYKLEPLFEIGVNVGLGLVLLEGVGKKGVELTRNHAAR